jgi:hypothetical protein
MNYSIKVRGPRQGVVLTRLGLLLVTGNLGCQRAPIEYVVDEQYIGPCLVLVTPPRANEPHPSRVVITQGVATMPFPTGRRPFIFKSKQTSASLTVIPIGQHTQVDDTARHVFQLTNGYFSRSTCLDNVANVSFYVGRKTDYARWSRTYHDETDYFASRGIDLCKLYTAGRISDPEQEQPLRLPRPVDKP